MNSKLLFPYRFKKLGWTLLVPGLLLSITSLIAMLFPEDSWMMRNLQFLSEDRTYAKWFTVKNFHDIFPFTKAEFSQDENLMIEIIMTLVAIGFLFVAFSKEKHEDEYISKVREDSLVWGFYVNIIYFLLGIWLVYGADFWAFIYWSLIIPPVVFLVRFHWFIYIKPYFEERKVTA